MLCLGAALLPLAACQSTPDKPLPAVTQVDLPRFMGDWYVIAHIPTFIERKATDAVESYRLAADGTIETTFRFREGDAAGPLREYHPRGFVVPDTGNAVWGMQFIWPVKAEYVISHVDAAYTETIIARSARDYVWIMARTPSIPEADFQRLSSIVAGQGYDIKQLQRVPQQWR